MSVADGNESVIVVTQFVQHKREKDFTSRKGENRIGVHLEVAAISRAERTGPPVCPREPEWQFE